MRKDGPPPRHSRSGARLRSGSGRGRERTAPWPTGADGGVFFFQAEDGIRDLTVTGVQTCALPISLRLNVSYNCLDIHLAERGHKTAIIFEGERGDVRRLSYRELHAEVCRFANALKAQDRKSVV